jgi:putative spermidine/putrescine transport system substrate-binding protein
MMTMTKTLTALTAGFLLASGAAQAQLTLIYARSGGGLAQVMQAVFDDPFTAETGIAMNALATSGRSAVIRAMMAAGLPTWDVVELNPVY